jgi:hypothetical protein
VAFGLGELSSNPLERDHLTNVNLKKKLVDSDDVGKLEVKFSSGSIYRDIS